MYLFHPFSLYLIHVRCTTGERTVSKVKVKDYIRSPILCGEKFVFYSRTDGARLSQRGLQTVQLSHIPSVPIKVKTISCLQGNGFKDEEVVLNQGSNVHGFGHIVQRL